MRVTKTDEYVFEDKEVILGGKTYKFRELSVEENDLCTDAAREEGGMINGRTMMRMMIVTSSVDPKITPDDLAKMPQRVYLRLCDVVNDLNNPDTLSEGKDEDKGND
jgi:hypothetical protein